MSSVFVAQQQQQASARGHTPNLQEHCHMDVCLVPSSGGCSGLFMPPRCWFLYAAAVQASLGCNPGSPGVGRCSE
jgi:hypothetical protein